MKIETWEVHFLLGLLTYFERERGLEQGGAETETGSQAGSELSAQNPTWGSIPMGPETKPRVGHVLTEPPRHPGALVFKRRNRLLWKWNLFFMARKPWAPTSLMQEGGRERPWCKRGSWPQEGGSGWARAGQGEAPAGQDQALITEARHGTGGVEVPRVGVGRVAPRFPRSEGSVPSSYGAPAAPADRARGLRIRMTQAQGPSCAPGSDLDDKVTDSPVSWCRAVAEAWSESRSKEVSFVSERTASHS